MRCRGWGPHGAVANGPEARDRLRVRDKPKS